MDNSQDQHTMEGNLVSDSTLQKLETKKQSIRLAGQRYRQRQKQKIAELTEQLDHQKEINRYLMGKFLELNHTISKVREAVASIDNISE